MKRLTFLCLVVAYCPAFLYAGPIYGAIFFGGSALRGANISIACDGGARANGSTLDDGSYRIPVAQEGRCTFTVASPASFPGTASASVVLVSSAAQYNFVVVKGSGGYELRRQ